MQRGDRVGIYLDPSVEQVLSIFSISQAGGVYVPINTVLFPEQVAHIARDCGMKALITTPDKLEVLRSRCTPYPPLQFFVVTGKSNGHDSQPSFQPVYISFEEMLQIASGDALEGLGYLCRTWQLSSTLRFNREAERRDAEPRERDGRQHDCVNLSRDHRTGANSGCSAL